METYYNPYYYSNFQSRSEVSLFNGDGVDQWLNQIEGFFIRYQVIPEQKLAVADRYLTGETLDWYQQWHREIWWCSYSAATWEEFVRDLKIRFKPPEIQMTHAEIDDSFWRKWDELKQMVREMKSDHLASVAELSSKRNFFAPIKSVFNPVVESIQENMESASVEVNEEPDDDASDLSTNVVEESDEDDLIVDMSNASKLCPTIFYPFSKSISVDISSVANSFSALQTKVSFNTTYGICPQVLNLNNDTLGHPQGDRKCEMLFGDLNGIEHPYSPTVCENDTVDTEQQDMMVKNCEQSVLAANGLTNICAKGIRQNVFEVLILLLPPAKPPDHRFDVFEVLNSGFTVAGGVDYDSICYIGGLYLALELSSIKFKSILRRKVQLEQDCNGLKVWVNFDDFTSSGHIICAEFDGSADENWYCTEHWSLALSSIQRNESLFWTITSTCAGVRLMTNLRITLKQDPVLCQVPQYRRCFESIALYGVTLVVYYLNELTECGLEVLKLKRKLDASESNDITSRAFVVINHGNPHPEMFLLMMTGTLEISVVKNAYYFGLVRSSIV